MWCSLFVKHSISSGCWLTMCFWTCSCQQPRGHGAAEPTGLSDKVNTMKTVSCFMWHVLSIPVVHSTNCVQQEKPSVVVSLSKHLGHSLKKTWTFHNKAVWVRCCPISSRPQTTRILSASVYFMWCFFFCLFRMHWNKDSPLIWEFIVFHSYIVITYFRVDAYWVKIIFKKSVANIKCKLSKNICFNHLVSHNYSNPRRKK